MKIIGRSVTIYRTFENCEIHRKTALSCPSYKIEGTVTRQDAQLLELEEFTLQGMPLEDLDQGILRISDDAQVFDAVIGNIPLTGIKLYIFRSILEQSKLSPPTSLNDLVPLAVYAGIHFQYPYSNIVSREKHDEGYQR